MARNYASAHQFSTNNNHLHAYKYRYLDTLDALKGCSNVTILKLDGWEYNPIYTSFFCENLEYFHTPNYYDIIPRNDIMKLFTTPL
jgi:hypothetical protein